MVPATLARKSEQTCQRRLRYEEQVQSLRRVARDAIEAVKRVRAPSARLGTLHSIHEAVNRKAVFAWREQLGQLHLRRTPVAVETFEDIVLLHQASGRQSAPLRGDALDLAAQCDLFVKQ